MRHLSLPKLLIRRLTNDWKLLTAVFFGIAAATALAAGAPLYLRSLDQVDFEASVDRLDAPTLTLLVFGPDTPASESALEQIEASLSEAIETHLSPIYLSREKATKGPNSLLGVEDRPIPPSGGKGVLLSRGFLQSLSNLESHSRFLEGRMATDETKLTSQGLEVEAVIGSETASRFSLGLDDVVGFSPGIESLDAALARIVGIIEPKDPTSDLWRVAAPLLAPDPLTEPPPLLIQVDPEEPPVSVFVTREALLKATGEPAIAAPLQQEVFLASNTLLVGLPSRPLPLSGGTGILAYIGYLQNLSNLEQHARFLEGGMAGSRIVDGPNGKRVEAVIATQLATRYHLEVGDTVELSPSLGLDTSITAEITGIIEPTDRTDAYWSLMFGYLIPSSLVSDSAPGGPDADPDEQPEGGIVRAPGIPLGVQPSGRPPLPLMTSEEVLAEATSATFPGSLARATWFIDIDTEALKELPIAEARQRLLGFEEALQRAMPGVDISPGAVRGLTEEEANSNLLSSVPLRLQMTVLVGVALLFLAMMVFHLVQARESDSAMMRSRGLGVSHLLNLYVLEGFIVAPAATVAGILLALGGVTLAGTMPSFQDLTDGDPLPLRVDLTPIVYALAVGLLCHVMFVVLGVLSAMRLQLVGRFSASRPSETPFFQRYYLDIVLMAIGAFVFWELDSRGQFVSGGLFKDVEVNETLLLAPGLFLIAAALIFNRLFPLIVRFLSGESAALVHLVTVAAAAAVAVGTIVESESEELGLRVGVGLLLLGLLAVYWVTNRIRGLYPQVMGLLIQAALVAAVLAVQRPERGDLLFAPLIVLLSIVPAQLLFRGLREAAAGLPAWVSVGLWHMSRNSVQYNWLVLLMVLVTGVAVLAATVGQTFDRGRRDSLHYSVGSDLRLTGVDMMPGGVAALREQHLSRFGVSSAVVYRTAGTVSTDIVDVLAVEPDEFEAVSWYRDDFSSLPLEGIMGRISPEPRSPRITIPRDTESIGMWVRAVDLRASQSVAVVLSDPEGETELVFLGTVVSSDWQLLRTEVAASEATRHLASVVTFEPPGMDLPLAGSIQVDNLHVTAGVLQEEIVLEDFEGQRTWVPIALSTLASESEFSLAGDAFDGNGAGLFSFGIRSLNGFRGFYPSPSSGAMPVVVSSSLDAPSAAAVGDLFVVEIGGRWIPARIADIVEYFPTTDEDRPFILADLESLQAHLNAFPAQVSTKPNELLIGIGTADRQALVDTLAGLEPAPRQIMDLALLVDEQELDPFTTAAWRPVAYLSIGMALIATAVTYMAYVVLFLRRSRVEMGALASLGLSRGQTLALLVFEHLSIAAIGIGVGVWASFMTRSPIVSPLAVTTEGGRLVPPFVMTTDWGLLIPIFAIQAAFLLVGLLVLSRRAGDANLSSIVRRGEV